MTALPVLPADATTETPFLCEKFSCLLTYRACLRRQAERRRQRNSKSAPKPVYPFCASECGVGAAIAERFGGQTERVLHDSPWGHLTQFNPPARPAQEEERVMAKTNPTRMRGEPMKCCGSRGQRHLSSCRGAGEKTPEPQRAQKPARGRSRVRVRELDGEELLARRDELRIELADVDEQLRDRLASEEAKLERLREAVGVGVRLPPEARQEGGEAAA